MWCDGTEPRLSAVPRAVILYKNIKIISTWITFLKPGNYNGVICIGDT